MECSKCGARRKAVHPKIKAFIEAKGQFTRLLEFDHEAMKLMGKGGRYFPIPAVLLLLAGALIYLFHRYGGMGVFGAGAGWILFHYSKGTYNSFEVDFKTKPPTWTSNNDRHWQEVKSFVLTGRIDSTPRLEAELLALAMANLPKLVKTLPLLIAIGAAIFLWNNTQTIEQPMDGVAQMLEDRGLYLLPSDPQKRLSRAAARDDIKAITEALMRGAKVNEQDEYGRVPLNEAAKHSKQKAAEKLLSEGASPDKKDASGSTALHHAAKRGDTEIMRKLIEKGADPDAKDAEGKTPGDLAQEKEKSAEADSRKADARQLLEDLNGARNKRPIKPDEIPQMISSGSAVDFSLFYFADKGSRVVLGARADDSIMLQETRTFEGNHPTDRSVASMHPHNRDGVDTRDEYYKIEDNGIFRGAGAARDMAQPRYIRLFEILGDGAKVVSLNTAVPTHWTELAPCVLAVNQSADSQAKTETHYCKGYGISRIKSWDSNGKVTDDWIITTRLPISHVDNPPITMAAYEDLVEGSTSIKDTGKFQYRKGIVASSEMDWEASINLYAKGCERQYGPACLGAAEQDNLRGFQGTTGPTLALACKFGEPVACKPSP